MLLYTRVRVHTRALRLFVNHSATSAAAAPLRLATLARKNSSLPSFSPGVTSVNTWADKSCTSPMRMAAASAVVKKKSVGDLAEGDLKGKKVLVRCDLNVPLDGKTIGDDTRIRASIPTVEYLLSNGARVALSSHLGRPKDGPEDKFSLGPVAERLTQLLGKDCKMAPDCIGDDVAKIADSLADGEVMLLENVRFYPAETKNEPGKGWKEAWAVLVGFRTIAGLVGCGRVCCWWSHVLLNCRSVGSECGVSYLYCRMCLHMYDACRYAALNHACVLYGIQ